MACGVRPISMTFSSSESLYGRLGAKAGLRMWLSKVIIQVWPSGGDLAATAEPTTPVPPGLLSTMMFQPVFSISLAWMMRATGSVEPPGGKGTMILIGPLGQSPCARTMAGAAGVAGALAEGKGKRLKSG